MDTQDFFRALKRAVEEVCGAFDLAMDVIWEHLFPSAQIASKIQNEAQAIKAWQNLLVCESLLGAIEDRLGMSQQSASCRQMLSGKVEGVLLTFKLIPLPAKEAARSEALERYALRG